MNELLSTPKSKYSCQNGAFEDLVNGCSTEKELTDALNYHVFKALRRLDVMPVKIHKVQRELVSLIYLSKEKLAEGAPRQACKCETRTLMKEGCQCGGV